MSQHLWSGRFDSAPDPAAFDFGVSFPFDRRLFEDDVTGSIAWAEALEAGGMLSREDAKAIVGGLKEILEEGRRNPESVVGPDEDVHSFVERRLIERIGDAGRRLHTGRSRNEQVSLDLRLYLRRKIPVLQRAVAQHDSDFEDLAAPGKPQALIVAPTRELTLQVSKDLTMAGKDRGIRVLTVYGGVPYEP